MVVLTACWVRLGYGLDLSDEAYYVALAYRFALGDIPFEDELHLSQSAALLTWPLVEAYLWQEGTTDGLVLFLRRAFFAFQCGVSAVVFLALRTLCAGPAALVIALLPLALLPFGIPNLSYNTLGSGLFTAGVFVALPWGNGSEVCWRRRALAGACHGLAVVSYPPLLVAVLCSLAATGWLDPRGRRRLLASYAGGVAAVLACWVLFVEWEGMVRVYDFMSMRYQPDPDRLVRAVGQFVARLPSPLLLALGIGLLFWQRARRPWLVLLALPCVAAALAWPLRRLELSVAPLLYVTSLAWLAPLLLPWVWRERTWRRVFAGVWLPSVVAGLTFATASTNGYLNAGLGLVPAAIVTLSFLDRALQQASDALGAQRAALAPILGVLAFVAMLLSYQRGLYRGGPIWSAPLERVTAGPFAGIDGHPVRGAYLRVLATDLAGLAVSGGRVLFYDHFPAGYLLTDMRPATPSLFTCFLLTEPVAPGFCAAAYAAEPGEPTLAVHVPAAEVLGNRFRAAQPTDVDTARLIERAYEPLAVQRDRQQQLLYEVFRPLRR